MSFISKWFRPSLKQLKSKGDVEGLAKEFQHLLKSNSLLDLQKSIVIIGYLNDLEDSRGIEFLPVFFNTLFLHENATPADYRQLGIAALKTVVNKGDNNQFAALNEIGTKLDLLINLIVEILAPTPPHSHHFDIFRQKGAVFMELRKEININLENQRRMQTVSDASNHLINSQDGNMGIRKQLEVLDNAYLCRSNDELEKQVAIALASILSEGENGLNLLIERLFKGIVFSGNNISLYNWGDGTWNELMKKQAIVKALGVAKSKGALGKLEELVNGNCNYGQWRECIAGPLSRAITAINS